jgi:hypothetical protein
MNQFKTVRSLVSLGFLLVALGCTSGRDLERTANPQASFTAVPSPTTHSTTSTVTSIPTETQILKPTPTETLRSTSTASPMPSPTPTSTPATTRTPQPTLLPQEAMRLVSELLETNGGCRLPCWWGITPGETSWDEARHFLQTFSTKILANRKASSQTDGVYTLYFPHPKYGESFVHIVVEKGLVDILNPFWKMNTPTFQLDRILSEYGKPDEVYIKTVPNAPADHVPFNLILYYTEQRILAKYDYRGDPRDELIQACPEREGPELFTWSSAEDFIDEIGLQEVVIGPDSHPMKPIGEVTDLDIQQLYDRYKVLSNWECFETPKALWP